MAIQIQGNGGAIAEVDGTGFRALRTTARPFDHGALLAVGVMNHCRLVCRRRIRRELDREGTGPHPANLEVLDLVGKRDALPLRLDHLDALERKPIRPSSRPARLPQFS